MEPRLARTLLLAAALAAGAACAGEADVRRTLQAKFPQESVESVARTPFPGLYEVVLNGEIVYTDEKVTFMLSGNLVDTRGATPRSITRERVAQLTVQTLNRSLDQAIKRVRGSGRRVLYTFEDPNCPYCKQLQKELAKLDDVTIYTFLWPILSMDSVDKSRAVWCAPDRARAWDELMTNGVVPQNDGKCDVPLQENARLARRFGVRGTPALFFADGNRVEGAIPAEQLEKALGAASRR
jgi:thiol:disulfide interchange protein DsbC